jgi:hypothetical protein
MDHDDVSQLPMPLREALGQALDSLLDLHEAIRQTFPQGQAAPAPGEPPARYPRSNCPYCPLAYSHAGMRSFNCPCNCPQLSLGRMGVGDARMWVVKTPPPGCTVFW